MFHFQPDRASPTRPRGFAVATAVVCLLLVVFLAFIQVAHVHQTATDADHCQLCVVLHSVAPAAIATVVVILVQMGSPAPAFEEREVIRTWHPTQFTRPPPSDC